MFTKTECCITVLRDCLTVHLPSQMFYWVICFMAFYTSRQYNYTEFKLKTLTALYSSAGRTDKRDILDSSWSTTCLWCHTQRPTVLILQYELRWRGSAGERPEHVVTDRRNTEQRTECNENWQSESHAELHSPPPPPPPPPAVCHTCIRSEQILL